MLLVSIGPKAALRDEDNNDTPKADAGVSVLTNDFEVTA
jgi:hypothetical protein